MHKRLPFIIILFIIGFIGCNSENKLKPIFYKSNYITWWDIKYGIEETQNMDIYLRGHEYINKDSHNVRFKGSQPTNIGLSKLVK